jgi:protein-S-isoprenylcysteine O-methyltransferase Ste14
MGRDSRYNASLRIVVTGDHQFGNFYLVRLHLFQAANDAGLALFRRLQRVPCRAFTEMYGFPLTIYLLSGWLQSHYPNVDWFSHDAGHLLEMMFGWKTNPHMGPFHLLSFAFIFGGFGVISAGWKVLYEAQRRHALATSGIYAYVRHPQYIGFILVMFGFLLQWPTLLTLAMFPVLVVMYVHLARTEEREAIREFGDTYRAYMARVPGFFPRLGLFGGKARA